jgi:hypothetical protein
MPDPAASFTGHLETVDLNNQQSAILFRGNAGIGKSKVFALSAIIKTADYFLTHSNFKSNQSNPTNNIRVDTVHQSKGESLDAVLYVATAKDHIRSMLDGTNTEL